MQACFNKRIFFCLVLITLALLITFIFILPQKKSYDAAHVDIKGIYLIKPLPVPNFELTDNHGHLLTKNNLKGHWSFLFFGFSHCNMVCPVTMHSLSDIYHALETSLPRNHLPQVIFITVDPEHDSVDTLNTYVTAFNPAFIGARTNLEKTVALEKQFHVAVFKTDTSINHSSDVLLINPNAEIQAYFSFPLQSENTIQAYKTIINRTN